MDAALISLIEDALGTRPTAIRRLHGGCLAEVFEAELNPAQAPDGIRCVVAKIDPSPTAKLDVEGKTLTLLRERGGLPTPRVLHARAELLIMEFVEGQSRFRGPSQTHAAELLARLHSVTEHAGDEGCFGFEYPTPIGPIEQPNAWKRSWIEFFRDQRLLHTAAAARRVGRIDRRLHAQIDSLAARLDEFLIEPRRPSLIHGDVWTNNVLAKDGRITAFLDPAPYYAHCEAELAFITLFGTFGDAFFDRYRHLRAANEPGVADADFVARRRHVYNLYPLLVHTTLFDGHYSGEISASLARLGF